MEKVAFLGVDDLEYFRIMNSQCNPGLIQCGPAR